MHVQKEECSFIQQLAWMTKVTGYCDLTDNNHFQAVI